MLPAIRLVLCLLPQAVRADQWLDHRPALLDTNLKTLQWDEVPAELLQAFRRQHPDLVVDRPGKREE